MKFKIAVVQFQKKFVSPVYNLEKAEKFIAKASSSDAQIIVFPEYFIADPNEAETPPDSENKYRKHFQSLAKKYKIDIVTGSIAEEDRGPLYNTTYYIDSMGEVKARYRKINLWHPERSYMAPGDKIAIADTKYGKVGLIICWDLIYPELFREMVGQGVDMVICPSYWSYEDAGKIGTDHDKNSEIKLVDSLCVARAFENEIILVFCNAAGQLDEEPEFHLFGHSQIAVPFKGAINKMDHNQEGMFIQEVDTDILKDAESSYTIRADLKKRKL